MRAEPPRIAIIGGGVAGLATAICLRAIGAEVRVYERAPEYGPAGQGFLLLPNGLAALDRMGLGAAVRAAGSPITRAVIRQDNGELLADTDAPSGSALDAPDAAAMLCVTRADLLAVLRAALPADVVETGMAFEGLERREDGEVMGACFAGGHVVRADLFVGADGTRSRVRRALFPEHPMVPGRVDELVCLLDCPALSRAGGSTFQKTQAAEGGIAFGIVPLKDGRIIWFLQFDTARWRLPEPADASAKRRFVQGLVGGWPGPIPELLAATDFGAAHRWRTTDMAPAPAFYEHNVVLLGDAAHALLPFTSQGTNSALEDAVVLAECLSPSPATRAAREAALTRFEGLRREEVTGFREAGRALAERFLASGRGSSAHGLPFAKRTSPMELPHVHAADQRPLLG